MSEDNVNDRAAMFVMGSALNQRFIPELAIRSQSITPIAISVKQIIPAAGFVARFNDGELYPVVCWALREEVWETDEGKEYFNRVVGMIVINNLVGLQCVDGPDCIGFAGYER